ncbi:MAG: shikimate kinase [Lachnospiraceae bacterium]|nr:shikimate kinase [Lachnospiraceae bacterium]
MKNKLILIGFMGSGKTTVSEYLARHYQCEVLDTDKWIEQKESLKVSEIFTAHGEEYFRNLETKCLEFLTDEEKDIIIATGGGLPLREENRLLLRSIGQIIYLEASADEIFTRLKDDKSRPLLNTSNQQEKINELIKIRRPIYGSIANLTIETDGKTCEEISKEIISAQIGRFYAKHPR